MSSSLDQLLQYYKALGLEPGADEAAIKKAFKKRSRETHPDKNPDDPDAAAKFHAVHKAYEALTDSKLRAELEQKLAARAATAARFKEMDEAKRKMREALEVREKEAAAKAASNRAAAAFMKQEDEITRLRREGRERVEAANFAARQKAKEMDAKASDFSLRCSVKVKWDDAANEAAGTDTLTNDEGISVKTLSEEQVDSIFSRYGPVLAVLARKVHSACVAFTDPKAALAACQNPPTGFRVTPLSSDVHVPSAPIAGVKRSRAEMSATSVGPTAPPTPQKLSLEEHEARVWEKIARRELATKPKTDDVEMR